MKTISPARLVALGVLGVLALATAFTLGIAIGSQRPIEEPVLAADDAFVRACPDIPAGTCAADRRVRDLLVSAGAFEAHVNIDAEQQPTRVVAQVFLSDELVRIWDMDEVAASVARIAGTTPNFVEVVDENLIPLFSGGKAVSARPNAPTRSTPTRRPR
jgi:hypothetical protein